MSDYWPVQAPWDESQTIKVRYCKNGCKQIVYFNEHAGGFCNLNDGEQHDCPNFKKSSSQTGSSQGNKNQAQNTTKSPQSSNTNGGPVQEQATIELLLNGQLEELRRAVDHLSRIAMFVESLDFRVKKIEEHLTYSKVPARPILSSEQIEKKDFNPTEEEEATGYTTKEMEELK